MSQGDSSEQRPRVMVDAHHVTKLEAEVVGLREQLAAAERERDELRGIEANVRAAEAYLARTRERLDDIKRLQAEAEVAVGRLEKAQAALAAAEAAADSAVTEIFRLKQELAVVTRERDEVGREYLDEIEAAEKELFKFRELAADLASELEIATGRE